MGSVSAKAPPRLAIFSRRGGSAPLHVFIALRRRAPFVNGRKGQASRQAARGCACVYPGELERNQRKRQVLRSFKEPALFGIHEDAGDASLVEGGEKLRFLRGPFMRIPSTFGYKSRNRTAGRRSRCLYQHL